MAGFDPYHKWLGIPPEEQPANYYRLLGIAQFESDPDVIACAADRQMAHVRSFQLGQYSALSQHVLNEIAAAKMCLLNVQRKTDYDQRLRLQLNPPFQPLPPQPPQFQPLPSQSSPAPTPPVDEPIVVVSQPSYSARVKKRKRQSASWMSWVFTGVGGLLLVAVVMVLAQQGRQEVRQSTTTAQVPSPTQPRLKPPQHQPPSNSPKHQAQPVAQHNDTTRRKAHLQLINEPNANSQQTNADSVSTVEVPEVEPMNNVTDERQTSVSKRAIERIVLWNQYNSRARDRGSNVCNVILLRDEKELWRADNLHLPWDTNQDKQLTISLPQKVAADTVRVEVVKWHGLGGGLAEVEVYSDNRNIAEGCEVTASAAFDHRFPSKALTDGTNTSSQWAIGYWLLPDNQPGWAEIHLSPTANDEDLPEIASKLPMPDENEQAKVLATIREVYEGETDKAALAQKLYQRAIETRNQVERFVLLREAIDTAAEAWQDQLAFEAVDLLASEYDVSTANLKAKVFFEVVKRPNISPAQKTVLALAALQVVDVALFEDELELAQKLCRRASDLIRQAGDKNLLVKVVAKQKTVQAASQAWNEYRLARTILSSKPNDPDANTTVGKYLCFIKDDWETGIPMLFKGSDVQLKTLAKKELDGVASTEEQVKIGDLWWETGGEKRAIYWYKQALPILSGLERDRIQFRLEKSEIRATDKKTVGRRRFAARFFVACDDFFDLHVNGVKILEGHNCRRHFTADYLLSRGDIITVKCHNIGGPRGFACAIVFEKRAGIVSGPDWKSYKPKSEHEWYLPDNIDKTFAVVPGDSAPLTKIVQNACGVSAPVIWGQYDTCYLFIKVR